MAADRTPQHWLDLAADPAGDALDAALEALLARQQRAHAAALRVAGREPLGLRIIDLGDGNPHTLCAFAGPGFLCLRSDDTPQPDRRHVVRHAAAGLLWEHVEGLVDAARFEALATAGGRLRALALPQDVADAVDSVVEQTIPIVHWRTSPLRAVVDMSQLDVLTARHTEANRAFSRFVSATDPLAEEQSALDAALVSALGDFERAAVDSGVTERLADVINAALVACDDAANEMADAHLTPLRSV
ncbi:MAG: hypothetical protein R2878_12530 [Thermoleophilia bacterium]